MAGKTLEHTAAVWKVTPVEAYMPVIKATESKVAGGEEQEEVIGTSMSEDDVRWFIANPRIMFCSHGELHGTHPRGRVPSPGFWDDAFVNSASSPRKLRSTK